MRWIQDSLCLPGDCVCGRNMASLQTRKKEHMDKVRLTNEDLRRGNTLSAEKRVGKEDGGLARHTMECQSGVDWENAEIKARERGLTQRKIREGIESIRQRHYGMKVLNNLDHVDTWRPVLNSFFDSGKRT